MDAVAEYPRQCNRHPGMVFTARPRRQTRGGRCLLGFTHHTVQSRRGRLIPGIAPRSRVSHRSLPRSYGRPSSAPGRACR